MNLKSIADLGATGIILVSFFSAGLWLLRSYLPQQREDFKNMLERQRQDSIKTLGDIVTQFRAECQSEREMHMSVQGAEKDAHQNQIEEIKLEMLALTKEIHRSNLQFSHFITIWISTLTNKPEAIIEFFKKLNDLNGK